MSENENLPITEKEMQSPREKGEAFLGDKRNKFKEFISNVFTSGEYDLGEKIANGTAKIAGLGLAGLSSKLIFAPSPDAMVDPRIYGVMFAGLGLSLFSIAAMRSAENRRRIEKFKEEDGQ